MHPGIVICYGIQRRLRFGLHHLNCVKMAAVQFYLQSGKQGKVGWVEDSHIVFGKKFQSENGSVRRCVVVMQQPVLFVAKVR
jgi:hypothetical protein